MVSLENRTSYLEKVNQSPKLLAFYNMLFGNKVIIPSKDELSEIDIIYFNILQAISENDLALFSTHYQQISKRNPDKGSNSPFLFDDLLIYSIILGIILFKQDKNWIGKIISLRNQSAITTTFESILNENYFNKNNLSEIIIPFLFKTNSQEFNSTYLNEAFQSLVSNYKLYINKNDFQIICSIRSFDIILILKNSTTLNEINLLQTFEKAFLKRIKWISIIIFNVLLLLCLYGIIKLLKLSPYLKEQLNDVAIVITIFGVGIAANLISKLRSAFYDYFLFFLGYPRELLIKRTR